MCPNVAVNENLWCFNVVTWESVQYSRNHASVYRVCHFIYVTCTHSLPLILKCYHKLSFRAFGNKMIAIMDMSYAKSHKFLCHYLCSYKSIRTDPRFYLVHIHINLDVIQIL